MKRVAVPLLLLAAAVISAAVPSHAADAAPENQKQQEQQEQKEQQDEPSKLEKKLEDIQKKLPEVKTAETVITVSPRMRIFLPNGSFDLNLRQEYLRSVVTFSSKYDFINNFMGFNLDFLYRVTPLAIGVNLNDRVDFNQLIDNKQYLQRTQSMFPYVQYPIQGPTKVRTGLRIENTLTSTDIPLSSGTVTAQQTVDEGRNIVGEVKVWNDTLDETGTRPRGGVRAVTLQNSFKNLGSDYAYTQLEGTLHEFARGLEDHFVEWDFQTGYPLAVTNRPLTSFYTMGGYRILRGYSYNEFRGDALIYSNLKYHIPLSEANTGNVLGVTFSMVTWNLFIEGCKIGNRDIFSSTKDVKWDAGSGFGYQVVFLKIFPVQLELGVAKAFEDRLPQYYFTVSTIYYTWRND